MSCTSHCCSPFELPTKQGAVGFIPHFGVPSPLIQRTDAATERELIHRGNHGRPSPRGGWSKIGIPARRERGQTRTNRGNKGVLAFVERFVGYDRGLRSDTRESPVPLSFRIGQNGLTTQQTPQG